MKLSDAGALVEGALKDIELPKGELAGLYEPVEYGLSAGGKRLRPGLALMSAEAFGGEEAVAKALDAAVGLEMFHNFTLLHDDVMDNSAMRRNRPSVQAKWDVNTAILSGDTMLTLATQRMMNVDDALLRPVLDVFNNMAVKVYEGQRLDMDFETRDDVTREKYVEMIGAKTGALLGASARIGAMIGGADQKSADQMERFGYLLGLAFQIQDDWLDVYGDSTTFGKPIGGDINNGKKSFLLLTALESGTPEAEALKAAMEMAPGETKIKTVTRIYDKLNLNDIVRKEVARYSSEALSALKKANLSDTAKEPFKALIDKLTGRKK